MTRKECLEQAMACVCGQREQDYGKPEDCFECIASLWSAYLNHVVNAHDVGAMMILLKVARFKSNPMHLDSAVDCAGYAACMAETATAWGEEQEEDRADRRFLDGVFKKAEGNHPENPDSSPEFKRGDRVEVHAMTERDIWEPATIMAVYRDKDTCEWRYSVNFEGGVAHITVPSARVRPVSMPKAEGCESLVVKDAPQTKEELFNRIVDCNPSTFGCVHKPTGEELAEMAEEDEKHG